MTNFFSAIFPIGLILLIAVISSRTLKLERQTLSQLTVYVFTPALIADKLSHANISIQSTFKLIVGYLIIQLLLYGLVFFLCQILRFSCTQKKNLLATTLFANTGNFGLPFIIFSLGKEALDLAVVCTIISATLIAIFSPALLKEEGLVAGLKLTIKLPLFWATLGGTFLRMLAINLPLGLDKGITILGDAAIPTTLFILGMQLTLTSGELTKYSKFDILAVVIRLLIAPLVAYAISYNLGLEKLDMKVLVLQSSMPTAVNTLVWVLEFGGDASQVAKTIVVSTLMSFFTLPLVLWILST